MSSSILVWLPSQSCEFIFYAGRWMIYYLNRPQSPSSTVILLSSAFILAEIVWLRCLSSVTSASISFSIPCFVSLQRLLISDFRKRILTPTIIEENNNKPFKTNQTYQQRSYSMEKKLPSSINEWLIFLETFRVDTIIRLSVNSIRIAWMR